MQVYQIYTSKAEEQAERLEVYQRYLGEASAIKDASYVTDYPAAAAMALKTSSWRSLWRLETWRRTVIVAE